MKKYISRAEVILVGFIVCVAACHGSAEVQSVRERPPKDQSVVNGTADIKFSREWWKVENKKFGQALDEKNTEAVVGIAREAANGWYYDVPGTYTILAKAISYLQSMPANQQNDIITLINAHAEVAQYVRAGNDLAKDFLASQVLCAPYERAMVYKKWGQDVLALQELKHFYEDGWTERERIRSAFHAGSAACPCEEKSILVELIQADLALALVGDSAAGMAQEHWQEAFDYNSVLMKYAGITEVFRWNNTKVADHFVNSIWTVSNLALYLARQMHYAPPKYIDLVREILKGLTEPEPFSLDDSILGQKYLVTEGASEAQVWDFLQIYQDCFRGWPSGENGFEYQSCVLNRLRFVIRKGNIPKAEAIIAELAGVSFADPSLTKEFGDLQFAFQDILRCPVPEIPMGAALDGMVKAMQADSASSPSPAEEDPTMMGKAASYARHNPASFFLLGITLACFVALIAIRIRRSVVKKD